MLDRLGQRSGGFIREGGYLAQLWALEQPNRAAILSALGRLLPRHAPAAVTSAPASLSPRQQRVVGAVFYVASIGSGDFSSGSLGDSFSYTRSLWSSSVARCPAESPSVSTAEPAPQPHAPEAPTHRPPEPPRQRAARPSPATYAVPNSEAITDHLTSTLRRTAH
jgi:hypothetical protein